MAQFLEYLKMAIDNLRSNKGRSLLTMLGIIIGISSVIMIVAIGNGASAQIENELNSLAGGQAYIYINSQDALERDYITQEDIDVIKEKIPSVKAVSPYYSADGTVYAPKGTFDGMITCGTEDLEYFIEGETISKGHFFSEQDFKSGKLVCVVNEDSAVKMFGTTDVLGLTIEYTMQNITQELEIVGLTKSKGDSMFTMAMDAVSLYVPYTVLENSYGWYMKSFSSMYVLVQEGYDVGDMIESTIRLLEGRHNNRNKNIYLMQNFEDTMSSITSVLSIITVFIIFVAAISLVVGGIGVMNIMLVSVTERTREIGIRKSLGAKTKSIMLQFLSESAIITLVGGLIGIIIGVLGAYAICALPMLGFAPVVNLSTVIGATVFSSAVGIFFGIYPAKKAAKLSPIEALRRN